MIIYLSTCDKTSHILPATIFLYKYFYKNLSLIRILGFSKPILSDWDRIEFISLNPIQESLDLWSYYLHKYFNTISDELVFFALDDFFPIDFMNENTLEYVLSYMKKEYVGFCIVNQSISSCEKRNEVDKIIKDEDEIFVYKRKKGINYQLVLHPGIWNRKYLVEALSYNCSPWNFELQRSLWANSNSIYYNIATSNFPKLNYVCMMPFIEHSALSSKWAGKVSVLGLRHEIVEEMIEKKLLIKDNLIIGAWEVYVPWTKAFTQNDLLTLSYRLNNHANNSDYWYINYNKYY